MRFSVIIYVNLEFDKDFNKEQNFMKIAYLLGSLSRGGTETLLLDVFKSAEKAQYEFIGVHRKDGPYKDDFYATEPKFLQCSPKKGRFLSYFKRLRSIFKENGIIK